MAQESDQIKRYIEDQRAQLGEKMEVLEARVRYAADWRSQVRNRPLTMLAAAFGGGILLAALWKRSNGRRPAG